MPEQTAHATSTDMPFIASGQTWTYQVQLDLQVPELVGKELKATFDYLGTVGDAVLVRFSTADEIQDLRLGLFQNNIQTLTMSSISSGIALSFAPGLVHFDYPLAVGKHWQGTTQYSGGFLGYPMTGEVTYLLEVVREECLQTTDGGVLTQMLENTMTFPAMGQTMVTKMWIDTDGRLVRRESYIGGIKVKAMQMVAHETSVPAMLTQLSREVALLSNKLQALAAGVDACGTVSGADQSGTQGAEIHPGRTRELIESVASELKSAEEAWSQGAACIDCVCRASHSLERIKSWLSRNFGKKSSQACVWNGADAIKRHVDILRAQMTDTLPDASR